ncbi:MAG: Transglutaminase-like enzyme putative cysteine protease [Verrucomicrobiaceae bacterium]|nr:Transglutaminase-like enzyme putative cysteine protease [Verrucomicrobiaceae bacterium]
MAVETLSAPVLSADAETFIPGMRLSIRHLTSFVYEGPARDSYNDARLCPISDPLQRCESFVLTVDPRVLVNTYHDFYHNRVDHFEIHDDHPSLKVESVAVVETRIDSRGPVSQAFPLGTLDDPSIEENYFDFLTESHYVSLDAEVWREGIDLLPAGVQDIWQDSVTIGRHIFRTFKYESKSTHVNTRMIESLRDRCGVCQDFAHVMIAICRTQGIPARYVSGYFFNEKRVADEAEASHAWVEIFLPHFGWKGFDPTHDRESDERYIKLAVGRDYADIRPISGSFRGKGTKAMDVDVRINQAA